MHAVRLHQEFVLRQCYSCHRVWKKAREEPKHLAIDLICLPILSTVVEHFGTHTHTHRLGFTSNKLFFLNIQTEEGGRSIFI